MRTTQLMGLTTKAYLYLEKNVEKIPNIICPKCKHVLTKRLDKKRHSQANGMFGEEIPLYEYTLKNGEFIHEVVQAEPWSSGPCIFLCLQDKTGKLLCKWPQKEIDNC